MAMKMKYFAFMGFKKRAVPVCILVENIFRASTSDIPIPPFLEIMDVLTKKELVDMKTKTGWAKHKFPSYTVLPPFLGQIYMANQDDSPENLLFRLIQAILDRKMQEIIAK